MKISEPFPVGRKAIHFRRFEIWIPKTTHPGVAHIIDHDDDKVGLLHSSTHLRHRDYQKQNEPFHTDSKAKFHSSINPSATRHRGQFFLPPLSIPR